MAKPNLDLSIIILNWNTKQLLLNCLESVYKHTQNIHFEVIVCDNASTDGSQTVAKKTFPQIKLIQNHGNLGFPAGNNPGLKIATGRYLLLLNTDTKIDSDVFSQLVSWMDTHPRVGIVGPKLLNSDGSLQPSAGYLPSLAVTLSEKPFPFHALPILKNYLPALKVTNQDFYKHAKPVGWVSGSCFFIRRQVYQQIGGLDEHIFMYTEETEYCYRARQASWQVWYLPNYSVWHLERGSSTTGNRQAIIGINRGLVYFFQKHRPAWQLPILKLLLRLGALARLPLDPPTYLKVLRSI